MQHTQHVVHKAGILTKRNIEGILKKGLFLHLGQCDDLELG